MLDVSFHSSSKVKDLVARLLLAKAKAKSFQMMHRQRHLRRRFFNLFSSALSKSLFLIHKLPPLTAFRNSLKTCPNRVVQTEFPLTTGLNVIALHSPVPQLPHLRPHHYRPNRRPCRRSIVTFQLRSYLVISSMPIDPVNILSRIEGFTSLYGR